jgi:hypothetical protein
MKKIFLILMLILITFIIGISSCKKESEDEHINNVRDDKGTVVFYVKEDFGNVDVLVDGEEVGKISGYNSYGTPDCGDSKCLTITLEGGSHSYVATCHSGTFKRSFTVVSGICNTVNIY